MLSPRFGFGIGVAFRAAFGERFPPPLERVWVQVKIRVRMLGVNVGIRVGLRLDLALRFRFVWG